MRRQFQRIFIILLMCVLASSGALDLRRCHCRSAAENAYRHSRQISNAAAVPEKNAAPPESRTLPTAEESPRCSKALPDENLRFLFELNLYALRQTNADVLGWIHIPDTPISYPLLHAEDNRTYLNKTWDGINNSVGSIYLECKNKPDFSDFNTLIYGHRMKNGSMFGSLGNYGRQEYSEEHPYVYIVTDDSVLQYEVFSAYEAPVDSDTYRLYVEDDKTKQAVLEYSFACSVLKSAHFPTTDDTILTLSTCTGTGTYHSRWVVQAMLTARWSR